MARNGPFPLAYIVCVSPFVSYYSRLVSGIETREKKNIYTQIEERERDEDEKIQKRATRRHSTLLSPLSYEVYYYIIKSRRKK